MKTTNLGSIPQEEGITPRWEGILTAIGTKSPERPDTVFLIRCVGFGGCALVWIGWAVGGSDGCVPNLFISPIGSGEGRNQGNCRAYSIIVDSQVRRAARGKVGSGLCEAYAARVYRRNRFFEETSSTLAVLRKNREIGT